jgi:hydroxypyruvate reductase
MTSTQLRESALAIFDAALRAADPRAVCREWALKQFQAPPGRVFVVGAGKASAAMAQGIEEVLGTAITAGLINVKYGHTVPLKRIELNECGHPIPDEKGVDGARRIAAIAREAKADDLVICLISGGASALLPDPAGDLTLAEKQ